MKNHPFIYLLLSAILGIVAGYNFQFNHYFTLVALFQLLLLSGLLYLLRQFSHRSYVNALHGLIFLFFFVCLFILRTGEKVRDTLEDYPFVTSDCALILKIEIEEMKQTMFNTNLLCTIHRISWEDQNITVAAGLLLEVPNRDQGRKLQVGQHFLVSGKLEKIIETGIPGSFNLKQYYALKSIFYRMRLNAADELFFVEERGFNVYRFAQKINQDFSNMLHGLLQHESSREIASAMLLGNKQKMSAEVRKAFSAAGVMHVLAVSGLHVGIIYLILKFLLGMVSLKAKRPFFYLVIMLCSVWSYAVLTGLTSSVSRASFMLSLIILGDIFKRRSSVYNTLSASAFLILFISPLRLFDLGFLLSYGAVLGILTIYPLIDRISASSNWLKRRIISFFGVSLAAQLGTLPIILSVFHQFPVYFLLGNILAIPLTTVIIIWSLLLMLFYILLPQGSITVYMAAGLDEVIHTLYMALVKIAELPFSVLPCTLYSFESYTIYMLLILGIAAFYLGRRKLLVLGFFLSVLFLGISRVYRLKNALNEKTYLLNLENNLYLGRHSFRQHRLYPLVSDDPEHVLSMESSMRYWQSRHFTMPVICKVENYWSKESKVMMRYAVNEKKLCYLYNANSTDLIKDVSHLEAVHVLIVGGYWNTSVLDTLIQAGRTTVFAHSLTEASFSALKAHLQSEGVLCERLSYNDARDL